LVAVSRLTSTLSPPPPVLLELDVLREGLLGLVLLAHRLVGHAETEVRIGVLGAELDERVVRLDGLGVLLGLAVREREVVEAHRVLRLARDGDLQALDRGRVLVALEPERDRRVVRGQVPRIGVHRLLVGGERLGDLPGAGQFVPRLLLQFREVAIVGGERAAHERAHHQGGENTHHPKS
jgi:hypothetical protein